MLEVGLVEWSGRQQHHARIVAVSGERRSRRFAKGAEEGSEPLDLELAEQVRKRFRHYDAILERVACARRRLRAVGNHPPFAIRPARQIHREQVQICVARYSYAMARSPEARVREYERRRNLAAVKQLLRAVKIGQNQVQQPRALDQACFQLRSIPTEESSAEWHQGSTADPCPTDRHRRCR